MSNINDEILEGNKLVIEFLDIPLERNGMAYYIHKGYYGLSELLFHSSWDWQIPVYSKVSQLLKALLPKLQNPEEKIKYYFQQERLYEKAVLNNEPGSGQKVIVSLIKFYNQNK